MQVSLYVWTFILVQWVLCLWVVPWLGPAQWSWVPCMEPQALIRLVSLMCERGPWPSWIEADTEGKNNNAPKETGHRHLSRHIKQFINWCENTHTYKTTHTLSHLHANTHTNVMGIPWTPCLLTHYLGSKRQRLEGEMTTGVIICRGKLQLSVMFVLWQTWQNGGFIRFTKRKDLFSRHHHVRVFEILRVLLFFFLIKAGWKWIGASVVIQAWRYKRDPHDHCPFPHHYSNSHGCNRLNWAIDFSHAPSLSPKKLVCASSEIHPVLLTKHHMLKDSSHKP